MFHSHMKSDMHDMRTSRVPHMNEAHVCMHRLWSLHFRRLAYMCHTFKWITSDALTSHVTLPYESDMTHVSHLYESGPAYVSVTRIKNYDFFWDIFTSHVALTNEICATYELVGFRM